ncbi:S53 family peptidase [Methylomonas sp. AM2-LC]|uniref:S53 family peptidase n=1 Tax=Methylomonas sp. AM2-LC TaxID=3153301 RepID=UPI00326311D3
MQLCIKYMLMSATLLTYQPVYAHNNTISVPDVSIEKPGNAGVSVHTHLRLVSPPTGQASFHTAANKAAINNYTAPYAGYGYQTPASIACIYGLVTQNNNCNPNKTTTNVAAHTGVKAIAIVDAYHYPFAQRDLTVFSNQFGLPTPSLQVVFASGSQPPIDPNGWEVEEALDLQWAHALAPSAKIYLVEAASSQISSLLQAVKTATSLVQAAGGGVVSMSWGSSEFSGETNYDSYFNNTNVIYFASSGDSAGVSWPCVSQNVLCVGGTSLRLYNNNTTSNSVGDFDQEVAWADGGGGISAYAAKPSYQKTAVSSGNFRGVPDIALAADPNSGAWVYYTSSITGQGAWNVVGGTSWSSPMAAAMTVNAGTSSTTTAAEAAKIYASNFSTLFTDTTAGWCGPYYGLNTTTGWDPCTGLGSYFHY